MRTPGFVDTIPSQAGVNGIEEVIGPICGYWLACYTTEMAEGFYAYAKLCALKPEHVWSAVTRRKLAAGPYRSAEAAISAVVDYASYRIAQRRQAEEGLVHSWNDTEPDQLR